MTDTSRLKWQCAEAVCGPLPSGESVYLVWAWDGLDGPIYVGEFERYADAEAAVRAHNATPDERDARIRELEARAERLQAAVDAVLQAAPDAWVEPGGYDDPALNSIFEYGALTGAARIRRLVERALREGET